MTKLRRRQSGEGTISEYRTKVGDQRYLIKVNVTMADGSRKALLRRRTKDGRPFTTRKEAAAGIRQLIAESERPGGYIEPTKITVGEYLAQWLYGLHLADSTIASYRRTIRLHVAPHIGGIPLAKLTATRVRKMYRDVEAAGLGKIATRYVGTVLGAALKGAVEDGLIPVSPAVAARKALPKAKEAKADAREMAVWDAGQVATFVGWAREHADPEQLTAWLVLLATGMRRGECLALRWRDIDLEVGTISVRRSVGMIKVKGEPSRLVEGPTKGKKSRVVAIDANTVAALRSYRKDRAAVAFTLGASTALVFGNAQGGWRLPDSFSWYFADCVRQSNLSLMAGSNGPRAVEPLPTLHVHSLRHTHATLALKAGVHPKIVQERLGHSSVAVTMDIYSHALPTMQRDAADTVGRLLYGA